MYIYISIALCVSLLVQQQINVAQKDIFLCPHDDGQWALRFAPVCLSDCLSVRPFVTLYGIEFV